MCETLSNFEPHSWLAIITSRDAKSACFEGSRKSCDVTISGAFTGNVGLKAIASRDGCFLLGLIHSKWETLQ